MRRSPFPRYALSLLLIACVYVTASAQIKPFTFIHITDTHVSDTSHHVETKAYIAEFNAMEPMPAFVVNSGDVTELGLTPEYEAYVELMKPLKPIRVDVPGNHDVRWSPLGKEGFSSFLGPLYRSWDHNGCHFVTLDSTALLEHWGHFEKEQLNWLKADLAKLRKGTPVFVFFHHWVGRDGVMNDNEPELLDILAPYNCVVFTGHGHNDLYWRRNGIPFVQARGLYQGSYHLVKVEADRIDLYRVRRESLEPLLVCTTPTKPRKRASITMANVRWTVDTVAFSARFSGKPLSECALPVTIRFDDGSWTALDTKNRSVSTAKLVPGAHRITLRVTDGQDNYETSAMFEKRGDYRPRWKFQTRGSIMGQPVVYDGRVYVGSFDGRLYAVNSRTGKQVWKANLGGTLFSSPFVTDRRVYIGSTNNNVYAVDRETGKVAWSFQTRGRVFGSPAFSDGIVCVASADETIYGIDDATGQPIWRYPMQSFAQSRAVAGDGVFLVGAWDNNLYALECRTGHLRWKKRFGRSFYYAPAIGSPITDSSRVYVPSNDNTLHAVDLRSGDVAWELNAPKGSFGYPWPTIVGDRLYSPALGQTVYCIDANIGKPIWQSEMGVTTYDAGAALCGDTVLVGSTAGVVTFLRAEDGRIIRQLDLGESYIFSTATADNECFYIGSMDGCLYALPK